MTASLMKDRLQECRDGRGEEGEKEERRSREEGGRTRFEDEDEEKRQEGDSEEKPICDDEAFC